MRGEGGSCEEREEKMKKKRRGKEDIARSQCVVLRWSCWKSKPSAQLTHSINHPNLFVIEHTHTTNLLTPATSNHLRKRHNRRPLLRPRHRRRAPGLLRADLRLLQHRLLRPRRRGILHAHAHPFHRRPIVVGREIQQHGRDSRRRRWRRRRAGSRRRRGVLAGEAEEEGACAGGNASRGARRGAWGRRAGACWGAACGGADGVGGGEGGVSAGCGRGCGAACRDWE
jgi:hypothetical protein